jgi:hypothetical protein
LPIPASRRRAAPTAARRRRRRRARGRSRARRPRPTRTGLRGTAGTAGRDGVHAPSTRFRQAPGSALPPPRGATRNSPSRGTAQLAGAAAVAFRTRVRVRYRECAFGRAPGRTWRWSSAGACAPHGDRAPLPHVLAAARPGAPGCGPSLRRSSVAAAARSTPPPHPLAFVAGSGSPTRRAARPPCSGAGRAALGAGVAWAVRLARGKRPPRCWPGCSGWRSRCSSPSTRAGGRLLPPADRLERRERAGLAVSIAVRWPLLGLVVGTALGQRTRWRRDPDLLRGYRRASWVWVGAVPACGSRSSSRSTSPGPSTRSGSPGWR